MEIDSGRGEWRRKEGVKEFKGARKRRMETSIAPSLTAFLYRVSVSRLSPLAPAPFPASFPPSLSHSLPLFLSPVLPLSL